VAHRRPSDYRRTPWPWSQSKVCSIIYYHTKPNDLRRSQAAQSMQAIMPGESRPLRRYARSDSASGALAAEPKQRLQGVWSKPPESTPPNIVVTARTQKGRARRIGLSLSRRQWHQWCRQDTTSKVPPWRCSGQQRKQRTAASGTTAPPLIGQKRLIILRFALLVARSPRSSLSGNVSVSCARCWSSSQVACRS